MYNNNKNFSNNNNNNNTKRKRNNFVDNNQVVPSNVSSSRNNNTITNTNTSSLNIPQNNNPSSMNNNQNNNNQGLNRKKRKYGPNDNQMNNNLNNNSYNNSGIISSSSSSNRNNNFSGLNRTTMSRSQNLQVNTNNSVVNNTSSYNNVGGGINNNQSTNQSSYVHGRNYSVSPYANYNRNNRSNINDDISPSTSSPYTSNRGNVGGGQRYKSSPYSSSSALTSSSSGNTSPLYHSNTTTTYNDQIDYKNNNYQQTLKNIKQSIVSSPTLNSATIEEKIVNNQQPVTTATTMEIESNNNSEELLKEMNKLEEQIKEYEDQLTIVKNKTIKPYEDNKLVEEQSLPVFQTKIQQFLFENMKVSKNNENKFTFLHFKEDDKIEKRVREPSEYEFYEENEKIFEEIKPEIIKCIEEKIIKTDNHYKELGKSYKKIRNEYWNKHNITKDDVINENIRFENQLAKIPPMLSEEEKQNVFLDNNGIMTDEEVVREYIERRQLEESWRYEEKKVFLDKFTKYPKEMRIIASYLPHKTTADVINFYYNYKMTDDFKKMKKELKLSNRYRKRFVDEGKRKDNNSQNELQSPITPFNDEFSTKQFNTHTTGNVGRPRSDSKTSNRRESVDENEQQQQHWTSTEVNKFKELLTKVGKDFTKIAKKLKKDEEQCRLFFETNKNKLKLMNFIKETNSGTMTSSSSNNNNSVNASSASANIKDKKKKSSTISVQQQQPVAPNTSISSNNNSIANNNTTTSVNNAVSNNLNSGSSTNFTPTLVVVSNNEKTTITIPTAALNTSTVVRGKKKEIEKKIDSITTPTNTSSAANNIIPSSLTSNSNNIENQPNVSGIPTTTSVSGSISKPTKTRKIKKVSIWTVSERDTFLEYFREYGRDWKKLSELIPTKTESQIKNLFLNYKVKLGLTLPTKKKKKKKKPTQYVESNPEVATPELFTLSALASDIAEKGSVSMETFQNCSRETNHQILSGVNTTENNNRPIPPPHFPQPRSLLTSMVVSNNSSLRKIAKKTTKKKKPQSFTSDIDLLAKISCQSLNDNASTNSMSSTGNTYVPSLQDVLIQSQSGEGNNNNPNSSNNVDQSNYYFNVDNISQQQSNRQLFNEQIPPFNNQYSKDSSSRIMNTLNNSTSAAAFNFNNMEINSLVEQKGPQMQDINLTSTEVLTPSFGNNPLTNTMMPLPPYSSIQERLAKLPPFDNSSVAKDINNTTEIVLDEGVFDFNSIPSPTLNRVSHPHQTNTADINQTQIIRNNNNTNAPPLPPLDLFPNLMSNSKT
ncbi:hypothetical protein ABK040_007163 [Willaertia magna]